MTAKQNKLIDVQFNQYGRPIGVNATKLATRSGDIIRTHVPISLKDWRELPETLRNNLWKFVTSEFKLPYWYKTIWLKDMSGPFRKYKSKLRELYLDSCRTMDARMKNIPPGVRKEDWTEFVVSEAMPEKLRSRQINSQNRDELKIFSTSGRRSHAQVEYMMNEEVEGDNPVTRSDVWLETHKRKDGSVFPSAAPYVEKVKKHKAEQTKESAKDILQDPLTKVFGLDKRGRVRAVGPVSRTQILASAPVREQLEETIKESHAKDEAIYTLTSTVRDLQSSVNEIKDWAATVQNGNLRHSSPVVPTSSSSMANTPPSSDFQDSTNVIYRLFDGKRRVVAHGNVLKDATKVHGVDVGDDEVKVRVIEIFSPETYLTSPTSFATTLGEVGFGGFTIWLKNRLQVKPNDERT